MIRGLNREQLLAGVMPETVGDIAKKVLEEEKVHVSGVPYKVDMVNSPNHYKEGGIETIDFIEAKATKEEFRLPKVQRNQIFKPCQIQRA